jgi:hypothetical protein
MDGVFPNRRRMKISQVVLVAGASTSIRSVSIDSVVGAVSALAGRRQVVVGLVS